MPARKASAAKRPVRLFDPECQRLAIWFLSNVDGPWSTDDALEFAVAIQDTCEEQCRRVESRLAPGDSQVTTPQVSDAELRRSCNTILALAESRSVLHWSELATVCRALLQRLDAKPVLACPNCNGAGGFLHSDGVLTCHICHGARYITQHAQTQQAQVTATREQILQAKLDEIDGVVAAQPTRSARQQMAYKFAELRGIIERQLQSPPHVEEAPKS